MEWLMHRVLRHKFFVLAVFLFLAAAGLVLSRQVTVNYDLAYYLPHDSVTKRAITVMEQEFGYPGTVDVMMDGVTIPEALAAKEKIKAIDGVKDVIWMDDLTDINKPAGFISGDIKDSYYKDGSARFTVEFTESDYSLKTGKALEQIRTVLGENAAISGSAESSRQTRGNVSGEIGTISIVVVPICVLILMFASYCWIEPLLYLLVIGVSIAINMGTNIFLPSVSFITKSMAGVLQLAVSMDYSLFLFHRYTEERDAGLDETSAIIKAAKASLSTISASALTTIAGFLALLFMRYSIGADLGIVLAKGIIFSFLSVILLLPVFILLFSKVIDKTRHRPLIPSFVPLGRFAFKIRYLLIPLLILLLVPAFLAQQKNHFIYGDTTASSSQGRILEDRKRIEEKFGVNNPVMLLIPTGDTGKEKELAEALKSAEGVKSVQAAVTIADTALPSDMLPTEVLQRFRTERYSRFIVNLAASGETPQMFEDVKQIEELAEKFYPRTWLTAGMSSSISDIKHTVEKDSVLVGWFSILAVGFIVLVTFRSISIPVLLVAAIQGSIWINMSIPYFEDSGLVFIGYLVVSSLQLGATIDYAILMSNRYMEFRRAGQKPREAALSAIGTAGGSVAVSALILTVAGFSEGILSKISSVSEIGVLLGRGAALSALMVLLILPILLVLFDKLILFTTLRAKEVRAEKPNGVR